MLAAGLEIAVVALGLAVLLADLWIPATGRRNLGYAAAAGLALVLAGSFALDTSSPLTAFGGMYVQDSLALFFKRLFLVAAIIVLIISIDFSELIPAGISEFYAIILFALSGMMFAASANDFLLLFVSLELITVSFYVLNSFQRNRVASLEAGVKYLILGAVSSGLMVYGIALVFGSANTTRFTAIAAEVGTLAGQPIFMAGLLLVVLGLAFKIAAFPFQVWAPDVYQGAPVPATAFLAVGSKAAGFVLLLRLLFGVVPDITLKWETLLMTVSAITILYGSLCAIPQRNLKRLLGYSSIANAGYLLLGITVMTRSGAVGVLYYLGGYLFAVLAAFAVIAVVSRLTGSEDISALAGLHQRSPLLASALTLAMVSLAGIPPLAGFIGKFLLFKAVIEQGVNFPAYYGLAAIALFGVIVSLYYYFGVVRAIYWAKDSGDLSAIEISLPMKAVFYVCIAGIFYLGIYPAPLVSLAEAAVRHFRL
jgi:NADH-quinone oxidoreductase subunit N